MEIGKALSKPIKFLVRKFTFTKARLACNDSKSVIVATPTQQCAICMEKKYVGQMFIVRSCAHSYCFSCMSKHVRCELHKGRVPKCPHHRCITLLKPKNCTKFLNSELLKLMSQRVHEASIPAAERIYCPNPRCSALFSKTELLRKRRRSKDDDDDGDPRFLSRKCCPKCKVFFCMDCKVTWHGSLKCHEYRSGNEDDEMLLKSLASKNLWRSCPKCNHMVSLASGCYHIYCRCGHEFCYTCGVDWRVSCKCVN